MIRFENSSGYFSTSWMFGEYNCSDISQSGQLLLEMVLIMVACINESWNLDRAGFSSHCILKITILHRVLDFLNTLLVFYVFLFGGNGAKICRIFS